MANVQNQNIKSVFDLTTELYGKMDYVFAVLSDNPQLETLEAQVPQGLNVVYDSTAVFKAVAVINTATTSSTLSAVILDNQTVFDAALQYYGGLTEGLFELMELNPALGAVDNADVSGVLISYEEQNLNLTDHFRKNRLFITTGGKAQGIGARTFDDSFDLSWN